MGICISSDDSVPMRLPYATTLCCLAARGFPQTMCLKARMRSQRPRRALRGTECFFYWSAVVECHTIECGTLHIAHASFRNNLEGAVVWFLALTLVFSAFDLEWRRSWGSSRISLSSPRIRPVVLSQRAARGNPRSKKKCSHYMLNR